MTRDRITAQEFKLTRRSPRSRIPDALLEDMLEQVGNGKMLRVWCREAGVSWVSIYSRINNDPVLEKRFDAARRACHAAKLEETLEISEDPELDPKEKRIRIWAIHQYLLKIDPARYSDSLQLSGPGGSPIQLTQEQRAVRVDELIALAKRRRAERLELLGEDEDDYEEADE